MDTARAFKHSPGCSATSPRTGTLPPRHPLPAHVCTHACIYTHLHAPTCTHTCTHPLGSACWPLRGPLQGLLTVNVVCRLPGQSAHIPGSGGQQHLPLDIRCLCLEMNILTGDRPCGAPPGQSPPQAGERALDRAGFDAGRGVNLTGRIPLLRRPCPAWPPQTLAATWAAVLLASPNPGRCDSPRPWEQPGVSWARPCLIPG